MKKIAIIICLLGACIFNKVSVSQDSIQNSKSLNIAGRSFYQYGFVLPFNDFVTGENGRGYPISNYQAVSLQMGKQTDGRKLWEQIYAYPIWGIGFNTYFFSVRSETGTPFSLYLYMLAPFKRWGTWSLNYEVGFGIAFNWKPYDPESNPYNIAIGSSSTVFFDIGMNVSKKIFKNFEIDLGFSASHFSNGTVKQPNDGINLFAPRIGFKYILQKEEPVFKKQTTPKYEKEYEWLISVNGGFKQLHISNLSVFNTKYGGITYGFGGISTTFNRQISHKSKFGIGVDVSYNGATEALADMDDGIIDPVSLQFYQKLALGVYPSFELVVSKVSIILQPGYYILTYDRQIPAFYQRIGIKYHFIKNVFLGINIRAYNFHIADYVEWNMGYRIKWK